MNFLTLGSQKIHSQLTKIELKKLLKAWPLYKYIMTMFEPIATFVKKQLSQNKQPHKKWTDSEKKKAFEEFWDFIMLNANPEADRVENNLEIRKLKKFHQNSSKQLQRDYYFVTICPPDSVKLELIMKTMIKISKWTCWSSFIGVLEQRSTKESDIYGIHIHFLAKKDKTRKKNLSQKIKNKISLVKNVKFDKNRLEQEIFYYLEKLDINEEIIRLNKHIDLFIKTIDQKKPIGKKLNFICQEIGREVNTIGSKTSEFKIQSSVINMKEYLEKIKEENFNIL